MSYNFKVKIKSDTSLDELIGSIVSSYIKLGNFLLDYFLFLSFEIHQLEDRHANIYPAEARDTKNGSTMPILTNHTQPNPFIIIQQRICI